MKAVNIKWDIDPYDIASGIELPNEIDLPKEMVDDDDISDYLSDVTGFCHKGFDLKED